MRLSYVEGACAMVMFALVEAFYVPYLHALGASALQIGLGVSLPALGSAFVQLYTPRALQRFGSRKRLAFLSVLVQGLCFVPFGLMCLLPGPWRVWPALAAFLVSALAGNLGAASWADWMADIVPRPRRGKFFARRSRVLGVIQLTIAVTAGFMLDHVAGRVLLAFCGIWLVSGLFRTVSAWATLAMDEPAPQRSETAPSEGFGVFLRELPRNNFGRFALATAGLSLAVNLAGPFFAVYMLRDLQLSYSSYSILNLTTVAATIAFLGVWGPVIDRIGAVLPLRLCALVIALLPLPWVLSQNYAVLLAAQVAGGAAWCGFNLAGFVFYLNNVPPSVRVGRIAHFNALNLGCISAGAVLGGLIAPHLPGLGGFPLHTIFVLSAVLRVGPALLFQLVKVDSARSSQAPLERLFFDPRLTLPSGVSRSVLRFFKREL